MAEHWILTNPETYPALIPRVDALPKNVLFARSVLTGDADGAVMQNDAASPSAWYIMHVYGMTLLLGDPTDPAFQAALTAHFKRQQTDEWVQASTDAGDDYLRQLTAQGLGREYGRLNFTFDEAVFRQNKPDARGTVSPTPVSLIDALDGKVVPRSFWKPALYPRCVSFTAYADGAPASTAFAAYLHGNVLELGIETQAAYRGQGYAEACCRAAIDYCLENNYTPGWSCLQQNTGSLALARKLGFVPVKRFPYYHFPGKG